MNKARYFWGIEIDQTEKGIFISQWKYSSDLLKEYNMNNSRVLRLPMDPSNKLTADSGVQLQSATGYQQLIGKLIYLTITRPDICFVVDTLSQFMQSLTSAHMEAAKRDLRYLKGSPGQFHSKLVNLLNAEYKYKLKGSSKGLIRPNKSLGISK